MNNNSKILAISGSVRKDSVNTILLNNAVKAAKKAGADVTIVDMNDYELPLYNGDLEEKEGIPENAVRLKKLFLEHKGFLIASPEYNSSVTPLIKNTIDWVSRPMEGESMLQCFKGKTAAIMSASPGKLGGLRGLFHLREILQNIYTVVIPDMVAIPDAYNVFDENGNFIDKKLEAKIQKAAENLFAFLK